MAPSIWQILIVLLIVLFIFGPARIPGLGKSLGEAIRGFRKGLKEDEGEENKKKDKEKMDSLSEDK
ncbi:MAG: twin-arginine translocase TatA/TatE family subunit [Bdellovibrionales bacterium]|nr:twin-arginine translocase TatA/TatE family subunit [Bdellovibrionales bacterium]